MISFQESLNSAPFSYDILTWSDRASVIMINGATWKLSLVNQEGNVLVMLTHITSGNRLTNQSSAGKALRLYTTIGKVLERYLRDFQTVKSIIFAVSQPEMLSVYKRLADRIAKQSGGTVSKPTPDTFKVRFD